MWVVQFNSLIMGGRSTCQNVFFFFENLKGDTHKAELGMLIQTDIDPNLMRCKQAPMERKRLW